MFTISKNYIITATHGDDFSFNYSINLGTPMQEDIYTLTDGDYLFLGVMEHNQDFEQALIKKTFTKDNIVIKTGEVNIKFTSKDTINVVPGEYRYEIKLFKNNGEVITLLNKKFILL